ncbi:type II toxin-antitoxin system VapC family toxin [Treponema primitia]|uniref:type II toxin-antitoxin system VapC family toxin n=1 Tax=Treponema primitia TaxID=88058 RepID=UPI003981562D
MIYVLDCSFCASLLLPDEETDEYTKKFEAIGDDDEVVVPHLWWYEISNTLKNQLRRKRLEFNVAIALIPDFSSLIDTTDSAFGTEYSEKLLSLAKEYKLSAYDAAYLELVLRKQAILGTLDDDLQAAAKLCGVTLL